MNLLDDFFRNFLENNFSKGTMEHGDYRITASKWNSKILWFNFKTSFAIGIFYGIAVLIMVVLFNFLIDLSLSGIWYFALFILGVSSSFFKINGGYIEVPTAHYALVEILGQRQGDIKHKPWHLDEGDYRQVRELPYYSNVFSAIVINKKLNRIGFTYSGNKTKIDAIPWSGKNPAIPSIIDPWIYSSRFLSTSAYDLDKFIGEIAELAIDSSFDEFTTRELITKENASQLLKMNYYKVIAENSHCEDSHKHVEFFNQKPIDHHSIIFTTDERGNKIKNEVKNTFAISDTGLAVRFMLTESSPPDFVQKEYNMKSIAFLGSEMEVIKAKGAAEALQIKGDAQTDVDARRAREIGKAEAEVIKMAGEAAAAAKKAGYDVDRDAFVETFNKLKELKDSNGVGLTSSQIKLSTELIINSYANEQLITISGPDGKQLTDQIGGAIMTFASALLKKPAAERDGILDALIKKQKTK